MRERHDGESQHVSVEARSARGGGLRWLAGGIALAIAGAITLATASASADAKTVNAELSFSGIATNANILGGAQIGVHPGDTVNFVPSTIPTAGLTNIPGLGGALDTLLQSLLGRATGYQVTLHLPATFPGGARNVTLGACSPKKNLTVAFPAKGDYTFTWSAVSISPLCLLPANIGSLAGNQLKNAGIALNATNQWVANIHVATDAVDGGISIQLPGVSIAPSLPGIGQLPTVGLPGLNLPTIPISIPGLTGNLPGLGTSSSAGAGSSGGPSGLNYTPPSIPIPEKVVPYPNVGVGIGSGPLDGGFGTLPTTTESSSAPAPASSAGATTPSSAPSTQPSKQAEAASSTKLTSAQLPTLLAILAIVALALVTGTYARLYMMRQSR
jgi:hypothetical protein